MERGTEGGGGGERERNGEKREREGRRGEKWAGERVKGSEVT